jgi:hypothetical protein
MTLTDDLTDEETSALRIISDNDPPPTPSETSALRIILRNDPAPAPSEPGKPVKQYEPRHTRHIGPREFSELFGGTAEHAVQVLNALHKKGLIAPSLMRYFRSHPTHA